MHYDPAEPRRSAYDLDLFCRAVHAECYRRGHDPLTCACSLCEAHANLAIAQARLYEDAAPRPQEASCS